VHEEEALVERAASCFDALGLAGFAEETRAPLAR
jgi:hypothetical protein